MTNNQQNNGLIKYQAISEDMANNDMKFVENEVVLETQEQKIEAMRMAYRLAVLRKFGIRPRNKENEPIRQHLTINGVDFRVKLPAIKADDAGMPVENIETYHNRVWSNAKIAFALVLKGAERIDFAPFLG